MAPSDTALATREQSAAPLAWEEMLSRAEMALRSGLLPEAIKTREAAAIVAMKGQELGLPMMQAFESIHVIQGRPSIGTEAMLALAYERIPGFVMEVVESTDTKARVRMGRGGKFQPIEFTFSIEDARRAGLASKPNWTKDPRGMCRWRALGAGLKVVCPDLRRGTHTVEEMEEVVERAIQENARKTTDLDAALDEPAGEPKPIEARAIPAAVVATSGPITDAQRADLKALLGSLERATIERNLLPSDAPTPTSALLRWLAAAHHVDLRPVFAAQKAGTLTEAAASGTIADLRAVLERVTAPVAATLSPEEQKKFDDEIPF